MYADKVIEIGPGMGTCINDSLAALYCSVTTPGKWAQYCNVTGPAALFIGGLSEFEVIHKFKVYEGKQKGAF